MKKTEELEKLGWAVIKEDPLVLRHKQSKSTLREPLSGELLRNLEGNKETLTTIRTGLSTMRQSILVGEIPSEIMGIVEIDGLVKLSENLLSIKLLK